jgi:predicted small secreted protein
MREQDHVGCAWCSAVGAGANLLHLLLLSVVGIHSISENHAVKLVQNTFAAFAG